MKTFMFRYSTNYNLGIVVVNAKSLEDAKKYAEQGGAWDTIDVTEIDTSKEGVILSDKDSSNF